MIRALTTSTPGSHPLRHVSLDRLTCLLRHWTWADEARGRFEQELSDVEDDSTLVADRPFGALHHWSALLCALSEVALDDGLLSRARREALLDDIESSLPRLRESRKLLISIPHSFERRPMVIDLTRNSDAVERMRRIHQAFGQALSEEEALRELASLDPD